MDRESEKCSDESMEYHPDGDGIDNLPPPPLPEGYRALGIISPLLGTNDALWGVLAKNTFLEEIGYLVYAVEQVFVFLIADEVAAVFDQLAQILPNLLPSCRREERPEMFARIQQALALYRRAQLPQTDVDIELVQDSQAQASEQFYAFLSCEPRQAAHVADLIEAAAEQHEEEIRVLVYGVSNKAGDGFLLLSLQQNQHRFLQWLRSHTAIQDFVPFSLH